MTATAPIVSGYSLSSDDLGHVEGIVGSDWESLRGAHVFITGGTGFFGRWLVESLLWADAQRKLGLRLTVLSRDPQRFLAGAGAHLGDRAALRFVQGRLTDFAFPEDRVTHIIHAASETNVEATGDWPRRFLVGALEGTRRILGLAAAHRVQALLLTTSGAVYGQTDTVVDGRCLEGPAGPADLVSEKSIYGQAKRMMEIMGAVESEAEGYRAVIARCFAFVGPYLPLDSNYAIGNFIRDALEGRDIVISGDGTPLRSYLYAADLAAWLIVMLIRGKTSTPYNVGGHRAVSIGELGRLVNRVAGATGHVVVKQSPKPGASVNSYLPSIARVEEQLGLRVSIDLEDAVARTLAWHRMQQPIRG